MGFAWNRTGSVTLDVQENSATAMQEPRYDLWGRNISTLGGNVLSWISPGNRSHLLQESLRSSWSSKGGVP